MSSDRQTLKIIHVFRAPVGGLFRHVLDLASEQAARGHEVGLIVDSLTGGDKAVGQLAAIAPHMKLGVRRLPMHRAPHFSDLAIIARINAHVARLRPDVVHSHGAKGGLYGRLTGLNPFAPQPLRVYTPHGGSFHQVDWHGLYMFVERILLSRTDLLQFESEYMASRCAREIGFGSALTNVARNGVGAADFADVPLAPDAAEFLYVGELAWRKGIDVLIEAVAMIHAEGKFAPRLAIVGSGPEENALPAIIEKFGMSRHVTLAGPRPAQEAFKLGRIVVAPSRMESLPYVGLEVLACRKTFLTTNVGGLPEIFGPARDRLLPVGDAVAMARAMTEALEKDPAAEALEQQKLCDRIAAHFTIPVMVDSVLAAYRAALAHRAPDLAPQPAAAE